mmetsp:Transcript_96989/g.222178  ORF Transcript_96989/g.222178 Transcript_96989/m.222178 type:complete len:203 (-) Transcript_96989:1069-1677(-)
MFSPSWQSPKRVTELVARTTMWGWRDRWNGSPSSESASNCWPNGKYNEALPMSGSIEASCSSFVNSPPVHSLYTKAAGRLSISRMWRGPSILVIVPCFPVGLKPVEICPCTRDEQKHMAKAQPLVPIIPPLCDDHCLHSPLKPSSAEDPPTIGTPPSAPAPKASDIPLKARSSNPGALLIHTKDGMPRRVGLSLSRACLNLE